MLLHTVYTSFMSTISTTKFALGALSAVLIVTGWGCQKRTVPTVPPQTNQPIVPSEASRSENYALVPLKQDLQVAPSSSSTLGATTARPTTGNSYYEEFAPSKLQLALGEQRPIILYFFAPWDETTLANDRRIATWINGDIRGLRGMRVNFDNEATLRKTYDVTGVNTAIFIGTDGKEKMRLTGSLDEEKFRSALTLIAQQ